MPNFHHPNIQCNNVETAVQSSPLGPPTSFTGILPLDLTEQAKTAVEEVLRASYKPSTPAFSNLINNFVQEPNNLFRGPYLSLDLPYTSADTQQEPFPSVPLGHTPYTHQLEAFQRLQPDALGQRSSPQAQALARPSVFKYRFLTGATDTLTNRVSRPLSSTP